jgi:hypothetical protein
MGTEPGGRGIGIDRLGSGSCCMQTWTLLTVPVNPAWSGFRWVAADDEHPPRGIEPAVGVVVHALAARDLIPPSALLLQSLGKVLEAESEKAERLSVVGGRGLLGRVES